MVWDISDPRAPVYVTYANNRDFAVASRARATWRRKGSSWSRRTRVHRPAATPCGQRVERHDDGVGNRKVGSTIQYQARRGMGVDCATHTLNCFSPPRPLGMGPECSAADTAKPPRRYVIIPTKCGWIVFGSA